MRSCVRAGHIRSESGLNDISSSSLVQMSTFPFLGRSWGSFTAITGGGFGRAARFCCWDRSRGIYTPLKPGFPSHHVPTAAHPLLSLGPTCHVSVCPPHLFGRLHCVGRPYRYSAQAMDIRQVRFRSSLGRIPLRQRNRYFDLQGHRGGRGEHIENTLDSFARGIIDGKHSQIELDAGRLLQTRRYFPGDGHGVDRECVASYHFNGLTLDNLSERRTFGCLARRGQSAVIS